MAYTYKCERGHIKTTENEDSIGSVKKGLVKFIECFECEKIDKPPVFQMAFGKHELMKAMKPMYLIEVNP